MARDWTKRALEHAEKDGDIRYGTSHGPSRILAVSDGDNAILRNEPDGRLQSDDEVVAGRTRDRAVGLGADSRSTQVGRRRHRRTGARSAWVKIENVGIPGEAATSAPAVE